MHAGAMQRRWLATRRCCSRSRWPRCVGAGGRRAGAAAADAEPNFAGDVTAPRPCAYDVKDPYEKKFYEIEGWSAPDVRALSRQVPADALLATARSPSSPARTTCSSAR